MTKSITQAACLPRLKASSLLVAFALTAGATSSWADDAAPVFVTAARQSQVASDVLADHAVITAEDIANSGAATLVDLLQQQRGIEITRNGGSGATSSVFIRGASNAQSVVLVDGVRIGSSTTGGATWETIPLAQIDHVEIVYGPLSSLYGADAMGGVVQVFTKAADKAFAGNVAAGVGSYGLRKAQAGLSGTSASGISYVLNAGHEENTGFSATTPAAGPYTYNPRTDGYAQDNVNAKLAYKIADGQEVGINFLHSHLDVQFDAGPGNYDNRSFETLGTVSFYSHNQLTQNWSSKFQIAQSTDKNYTDASYGQSQFNTTQNSYSWQNDIVLGKDTLQLLAERREEKVDSSTNGLGGERDTNSLAASYFFRAGAHLATFSLRNDDSSQYGNVTTGSVAYGYQLGGGLRVNASYGTSFRAPTFNELYYPGYGIPTNQPEKGKNAEAGIYYSEGGNQLSAVYYHNQITDLLVFANVCPVQPANYPYGCAYNVDQATLSGLTLSGATRFMDVNLRASLDLQNPRDDTTGLTLARRAKQRATLAADYVVANVKFGAETLFSGKRYDDAANTTVLPGYSLLNLYGVYTVQRNTEIVARWNNVLSKNYQLANGYATMGSNWYLGVNYGFK